jgi:hypothetical protein
VQNKIKVFTKVENLSISSLDLEVRVMKAVCDTPSCDGACVYKVSLNYLERIKCYGPEEQKVTDGPYLTLDLDL